MDGLAGGRVPRIERVEWTIITDPATGGECDGRRASRITGNTRCTTCCRCCGATATWWCEQRLLDGTYGICRFNTLQPPFNNPAIRRAVAMAVDQRDYLRAVAGDEPDGWGVCEGVFTCGTPLANEEGSEVLKMRSIERAKRRAAATPATTARRSC